MANEDESHLAAVRLMPCAVCSAHGADAHHAGPRGLGKRSHDWTAIPLCRKHHADWHDCAGHFAGWAPAERRMFAMRAAATALIRTCDSESDSWVPF